MSSFHPFSVRLTGSGGLPCSPIAGAGTSADCDRLCPFRATGTDLRAPHRRRARYRSAAACQHPVGLTARPTRFDGSGSGHQGPAGLAYLEGLSLSSVHPIPTGVSWPSALSSAGRDIVMCMLAHTVGSPLPYVRSWATQRDRPKLHLVIPAPPRLRRWFI
jgi:hypothetical protein